MHTRSACHSLLVVYRPPSASASFWDDVDPLLDWANRPNHGQYMVIGYLNVDMTSRANVVPDFCNRESIDKFCLPHQIEERIDGTADFPAPSTSLADTYSVKPSKTGRNDTNSDIILPWSKFNKFWVLLNRTLMCRATGCLSDVLRQSCLFGSRHKTTTFFLHKTTTFFLHKTTTFFLHKTTTFFLHKTTTFFLHKTTTFFLHKTTTYFLYKTTTYFLHKNNYMFLT